MFYTVTISIYTVIKGFWYIITMEPSELMPILIEIVTAIALGFLGSTTRIYIQYKRDGELPSDGLSLYVESFLGCMGGFLAWLLIAPVGLRAIAIAALIGGYNAADAIENWLSE